MTPSVFRHLFVGDSITHHGLYPLYLDLFYLTRFPGRHVEIINRGISGDTAEGALKRFPWDIAPLRAEMASIMFGMNDLGRRLYEPGTVDSERNRQRIDALDAYEKNLRTLVDQLRDVADKIVLLTPTIFDGTAKLSSENFPDYDAALALGAERVEKIGSELGLQVVDLRSKLLDITQREQALRPDFTVIGQDRIHPGESAHLVLTHLFLQSLSLGSDAVRLSIQAQNATPIESIRCRIDEQCITKDSIAFQYTAEALPFPVEEAARDALSWVPFAETFNQEILRFVGLSQGKYLLEIDDIPVCSGTEGEWSAGINLSLLPSSPQSIQAHDILKQLRERWKVIWKLRELVMVECNVAPTSWPSRPSAEQVIPLLSNRLETAIGRPWEEFIRRTGEEYIPNRRREIEWGLQIEEIQTAIRKASIPKPRQIVLRKSHGPC